MAIDDAIGEHLMFVSQQHEGAVDHNVISGLGSEGPNSIIDTEEGETKIRDITLDGPMSYQKSSKR